MNVNSSLSSLASAGSSWALQSASRRTASTQDTSFSTAASDASSASQGARRGPPPGPPPEFNVQRSTTEFAGSRGDPIASLDSDADGQVSAEEFGLDEAGSDVQELFAAIDADQDGSLSSEEIDSFRSQMQEAMAAEMKAAGPQGGRGPEGPPPPPRPEDEAEGSADTGSSVEASAAKSSSAQLSAMLQRIAQDYLRLMAGDAADSAQTSGGALSVTA